MRRKIESILKGFSCSVVLRNKVKKKNNLTVSEGKRVREAGRETHGLRTIYKTEEHGKRRRGDEIRAEMQSPDHSHDSILVSVRGNLGHVFQS